MLTANPLNKGGLLLAIGLLMTSLLILPNAWAEDSDATQESETTDTQVGSDPATPAAEEKKNTQRHTPDIATSRHKLLAEQLARQSPKDEIIWLKDSAQEYLALLRREVTGTPQGGILILHSQQSHGDWPENAGPIRQYLPNYGWTTLSIALPDPAFPKIPKRSLPAAGSAPVKTKTEESAVEEGETDDTTIADTNSGTLESATSENDNLENDKAETEIDDSLVTQDPVIPGMQQDAEKEILEVDIEEQMVERITQGITELQKRGQLNLVIIAQDYSVFPTLKYLTNEIAPSPKQTQGWALIIINHGEFENPNPENNLQDRSNSALAEDIAILNIPTLDLQYKKNKLSEQQAQVRKNSMRRNKHSNYTQVKLDRTSSGGQLQKRIRGWLKKHAAGTEVKNK